MGKVIKKKDVKLGPVEPLGPAMSAHETLEVWLIRVAKVEKSGKVDENGSSI
jgi:hypothetical protein